MDQLVGCGTAVRYTTSSAPLTRSRSLRVLNARVSGFVASAPEAGLTKSRTRCWRSCVVVLTVNWTDKQLQLIAVESKALNSGLWSAAVRERSYTGPAGHPPWREPARRPSQCKGVAAIRGASGGRMFMVRDRGETSDYGCRVMTCQNWLLTTKDRL